MLKIANRRDQVEVVDRGRMLGETNRFGGDGEAQCSGNSVIYMTVVLAKSLGSPL